MTDQDRDEPDTNRDADLSRVVLFDDDPDGGAGGSADVSSGLPNPSLVDDRPGERRRHPLAIAPVSETANGRRPQRGLDTASTGRGRTGERAGEGAGERIGEGARPEVPSSRGSMGEGVDWTLVRAFRQEAANQLTNATVDREGLSEETRRELGRKIIVDLLTEHAREADTAGQGGFDPEEQQSLAEAVYDALFGLGRLQPLVDNPELENIEVRGYDNVHLIYTDGRVTRGPAVADSDEELIDTLAFLAARSDGSERPFSPSIPNLDLDLPGDARLAASAWNTPRPLVVIRLHRLVDVELDDLVARDTLDAGMASFLEAAIKAKKSIVVSGAQGAGKTTLVRALCNAIEPLESIGTIETEFELHLHKMGDRHPRCSPWEARPGSGERNAEGRRIGEVTLDDILYRSLRMNLSRVIVGEVRGKEVIPMFKAMQAGAGSLSTTHSYSARAAVERLVTCATEAGPQISETWAYRQIVEHINIIVHVSAEDGVDERGTAYRRRFISEVIAIESGEDGKPSITDVYRPGPDGRGRPWVLSDSLSELTRWGFDDSGFRREEAAG